MLREEIARDARVVHTYVAVAFVTAGAAFGWILRALVG